MPQGFARTATGFRAWVRVSAKRDGFDSLRTKRFDHGSTVEEVLSWRQATRDTLLLLLEAHRRTRLEQTGAPGTFRADAVRYLEAVRALTTFNARARDVSLWADEFGDRLRASIQPHEIRAVRDRWLTIGPKRICQRINGVGQWIDVAVPLSASTVNHRLRALSNMWTVLNGRRAPNPVREVPEADEPNAIPRHLDYGTIRRIVDAMSERGVGLRGEKRRAYSLAKLCVRIMAWTGAAPKELRAIDPPDINWDDAILFVAARHKGRGAPGRIIPLGPEALEALRDFDRVRAYHRVPDKGVLLRAWHRGCMAVLGRHVRLYDLRHSFVTGVVKATGNLGTAQLLAGHTNKRTTQRYAFAAMTPMLRAGVDAFVTSVAKKEKVK